MVIYRELKETEDLWVSLDHLARAASLDLKDLPVATEAQDLKVSWARPDLAVLPVNLVSLVPLVLLVPLDLPDLLASPWVTTLLLWLLFLDRVRPR